MALCFVPTKRGNWIIRKSGGGFAGNRGAEDWGYIARQPLYWSLYVGGVHHGNYKSDEVCMEIARARAGEPLISDSAEYQREVMREAKRGEMVQRAARYNAERRGEV